MAPVTWRNVNMFETRSEALSEMSRYRKTHGKGFVYKIVKRDSKKYPYGVVFRFVYE